VRVVKFWLGTHRPGWLAHLDVPLMVSHRTLADIKHLPPARHPWVLDSGGFTELSMYGEWLTTPTNYIAAVRRYRDEIGHMQWAAPQDWMCEPDIIHGGGGWKVGTGLTVVEHQCLTVTNLLELRTLAPDIPFIPVLQGWTADDYIACADLYGAAGIDLAAEPVVGVGSVCRRGPREHAVAEQAIRRLAPHCGPLHGFGVSIEGLARYGDALGSSDSLAWSAWARRSRQHLDGCRRPMSRHGRAYSYANCPGCALTYRDHVLAGGASPTLFGGAA